ncbi:RCC1 repeat-containing protein [Candidatus Amarolinea dominans]|uniref:RCC1 domain-containing protein n=1 Tax=Candidatus Amarolinea dominans TaxID=3140696 RepID=UPI003135C8F0|nr:RCC1 repeat-containing protein [Anaerolineae bacterium]
MFAHAVRCLVVLLLPFMMMPAAVGADATTAAIGAAVNAGADHTCAVTADGGVKCWGVNDRGQLGDGTTEQRGAPVDVSGLMSGVVAVSAGRGHTCALTTAGGVKCWGSNEFGQLGDGTGAAQLTPVDVVGLTVGVTAISAGGEHTCALTTAGGMKCWGNNVHGQLGDGTTEERLTPVDVAGLTSDVTAVSAGGAHTCALTTAGGAKCWGYNALGQLGDGTTVQRLLPVDVVGLASGVEAVEGGVLHTCALNTAGGIQCWGANWSGQLGDGTTTNRLTPVSVIGLTSGAAVVTTGYQHTCAQTTTGGVKCWGDNISGQLGNDTSGLQQFSTTPLDVIGLAAGVASVEAGSVHTCALTADGRIQCWGGDDYGQLGNFSAGPRTIAVDVAGLAGGATTVSVSRWYTCALTAGGGVKCWGRNDSGQLGDGAQGYHSTPTDVIGLATGVADVSTGNTHACAVTTNGGVKCWGRNEYGQLGDGTTIQRLTPVDVVGLNNVMAVSAGYFHTCALTMDGGVKCWGRNSNGQLGDGTLENRSAPVDVSGLTSGAATVSAGGMHSCASTTTGGVKCWGSNSRGQLGNDTVTWQWVPMDVSGLTDAAAVDAGYEHTCAWASGGGAWCWGRNDQGQLGDGTILDRSAPVGIVGLTTDVTRVTAGWWHTCAIAKTTTCWGANWMGQLGNGNTNQRITPVDAVGVMLSAVVDAGNDHTCARTRSGGVKCWGSNEFGQLGVNPGWIPGYVMGFGRLREDLDGNGVVDVHDILMAAGVWRFYSPVCDLDGNRVVNIVDILRVARQFGQSSS